MNKTQKLTFAIAAIAVLTLSACTSSHFNTKPSHCITETLQNGTRDTNGCINVSTNGTYTRTETWKDYNRGGGVAWLTDPTLVGFSSSHENQTALGGSSVRTVGKFDSKVSTNAAPIIKSTGESGGQLVGQAFSASTGSGAGASIGAKVLNSVIPTK